MSCSLWLFIGVANLVGLLPLLSSPTRDLSLTAALALVSFGAGHVFAFRRAGMAYLRRYIEPSPFLLPFNVIGEISRTVAMALRLFGNMLSGTLIGAIAVYLAGLLIPVPLMLLGVLTGVVQAYIFGVLTLVFAAGSAEAATRPIQTKKGKRSS
jgi:F-type H+-transporting ATPase subunit a